MGSLTALQFNPSRRTLRQFGFTLSIVLGICALSLSSETSTLGNALGAQRTSIVVGLAGFAVLSSAGAILAPQVHRWAFVGLSLVTYPIGFLVSHVLMAILFFCLFVPLGLAMRALGKDPMHRRWAPDDPSYWVESRSQREMRDYFRQF